MKRFHIQAHLSASNNVELNTDKEGRPILATSEVKSTELSREFRYAYDHPVVIDGKIYDSLTQLWLDENGDVVRFC